MAKKSIEKKIAARLAGLVDALKQDTPLAERFTSRTVKLDLRPGRYGPKTVRTTRKLLNASQSVFAQFLGVSLQTVRAWEQGVNTPSDMACRFMDEIRRDPEQWRKRIGESIVMR